MSSKKSLEQLLSEFPDIKGTELRDAIAERWFIENASSLYYYLTQQSILERDKPKSWNEEALKDAKYFFDEYMNEIVQFIFDEVEVSNDINNDYSNGDAYFHESYVDHEYDLIESAQILNQLSSWKETDSGLWENLRPEGAIAAQAAYTYGNCVAGYIQDIIEAINDESWEEQIQDFRSELEPNLDEELDEDEREEAIEKAIKEFIDKEVKIIVQDF